MMGWSTQNEQRGRVSNLMMTHSTDTAPMKYDEFDETGDSDDADNDENDDEDDDDADGLAVVQMVCGSQLKIRDPAAPPKL
jgi:hypothetical protein